MTTLNPKQFIKQVFIDDLGKIINSQHYISFMVMSIGIEFLGKCLDISTKKWNARGKSQKHFENAVNFLASLQSYRQYLKSHCLYESLRCGMAHSASPENQISLSSGGEKPHLILTGTSLNLKCENFYKDFKAACEEVISMSFPPSDKMNNDFITIPGTLFNDFVQGKTAHTASAR